MAVEAQLYPESLDIHPVSMCGFFQDCMVNNNNNNNSVSELQSDFCFGPQQPLQHHNNILLQQQQSSPNLGFHCNRGTSLSSSSTCSNFFPVALSQFPLDPHLEMQRQELDCFLQFQNERLRYALQQQREQQLAVLLKRVESKALSLMRQKEEELAQATNKSMELEACLRKAQMDRESWQKSAMENEAVVMELSNRLEQVREKQAILASNRDGQEEEDAESIWCGGSCEREKGDDNHNDLKENPKKMVCKRCNFRRPCLLFLPCRHLCSCKSCEPFLGSCPVCESVKQASLEVFWV